jgi:galactose mutarotase-like enzyme
VSRRLWWPSATTAARKVQVRGAVDIGLTRKEAAVLLGTTRQNVADFAKQHGISFDAPAVRIARKASDDEFEPVGEGVQGIDRHFARMRF